MIGGGGAKPALNITTDQNSASLAVVATMLVSLCTLQTWNLPYQIFKKHTCSSAKLLICSQEWKGRKKKSWNKKLATIAAIIVSKLGRDSRLEWAGDFSNPDVSFPYSSLREDSTQCTYYKCFEKPLHTTSTLSKRKRMMAERRRGTDQSF